MKMIDHNHFICHLILGTFTEYPFLMRHRLCRFRLGGNVQDLWRFFYAVKNFRISSVRSAMKSG